MLLCPSPIVVCIVCQQVIVGAFLMDTKKDIVGDVKTDSSGNKSPSPIGGISVSNAGFPATVDSSVNQYMIQPRSMQMTPPHTNEWTGTDTRNSASYDFSGICSRNIQIISAS